MNKLIVSLLVIIFFSCSNNKQYEQANNGLDACRWFIESCLKGDFDKAKFYMIINDQNDKYLSKLKQLYDTNSKEKKKQYAEASIIIIDINYSNDSTVIMNFKNSFDLYARSLKAISNKQGFWQVDLSYMQSGNL